MANDLCSEETEVDCYELVNASCDSIGGSFSNKADCEDDLKSNESDRCYKCSRITDCDDCWSSNGRTEECWGVFPKTCSEIGGTSEADCEQAIEDSDVDAPCLKCVDQGCPETEDCFKVGAKTCAEICREGEDGEECCQEFCDEGQCMKECSIIDQVGKCPDCVECRDCYCPCVTNARIVAKINISIKGSGTLPVNSVPSTLPFKYSFVVNMDETVDMERLDWAGSICPPAPPPVIARCGSVYEGQKTIVPSYLDAKTEFPYAPGVRCPVAEIQAMCGNVTAADIDCYGAVATRGPGYTGIPNFRGDIGCAPNNHVCTSGVVIHTSTSNPDNGYCDCDDGDLAGRDDSNCAYCQGWDPPECNGDSVDCDDHINEYQCKTTCPLTENCWPLDLSWSVDFCPDTGKLMRVSGGYNGAHGAHFSFDSYNNMAPNTSALGYAYALNDYITVNQIPLYFTYNGRPNWNGAVHESYEVTGSAQIDFRYLSFPQDPVNGCDGNPMTNA